jgi:hypothetical protein
MYEAFGLWFYKHNPELFKEGITDTSVEKGMIKTIGILESRMRLDKGPNMVHEMIRRDNAMHRYLAELEEPEVNIILVTPITRLP